MWWRAHAQAGNHVFDTRSKFWGDHPRRFGFAIGFAIGYRSLKMTLLQRRLGVSSGRYRKLIPLSQYRTSQAPPVVCPIRSRSKLRLTKLPYVVVYDRAKRCGPRN